jgi:hypothetical protein
MVYGIENSRAVAVAAKDLGILFDVFIIYKRKYLIANLAAREKDHFDLGVSDHGVEVLCSFLDAARVIASVREEIF